jgi:hypothetical protein
VVGSRPLPLGIAEATLLLGRDERVSSRGLSYVKECSLVAGFGDRERAVGVIDRGVWSRDPVAVVSSRTAERLRTRRLVAPGRETTVIAAICGGRRPRWVLTAGGSGPQKRWLANAEAGRLGHAGHRGGGGADDACVDAAAVAPAGRLGDFFHCAVIWLRGLGWKGQEVVEASGEVALEAAQRALGRLASASLRSR